MTDYINRIAAIRAIIAREFHDCGKCERAKEGSGDDYCFNEGLLSAVDAVQDIPAADVVEVRHGHWIELENGDCECSRCGCNYQPWEAYGYYCQHCGAKMGNPDQEDEEEDDDPAE